MIFPILTYLLMACSGGNKEKEVSIKSSFNPNPITDKEKEYYANAIAPLYQSILVQKGFSGGFLAAKNGEIVFEDYRGFANYQTKELINSNTPIHLASISKTFTAMIILRLMEQGRLNLDDNVQRFLPTFPYNNITIKNLLTHRSGLPNYVYFMESKTIYDVVKRKNKKGRVIGTRRIARGKIAGYKGLATNLDVLQWMIDKKPPIEAYPDRNFKYCNTNYVLLALIAERASGVPFADYAKDSVFTPLGMQNSFVFSMRDTNRYVPSYQYNNVPYKLQTFDCVFGDKNVYSTVRDLLMWDKALYAGTFVSKSTLELAFTGYSNERRGTHNYGLGWRLLINPDETIVYHNGWWHGNNTVFTRLVNDTATIIVLGNKYNRNIYATRKINAVFTGSADTTRMIE